MRRKIFVNREKELEILESLWMKNGFALIIVYGRRRVGKTRLLMEFSSDKSYIYYVAVESPYEILCREFSENVSRVLKIPVSGDIIDVLKAIPDIIDKRILIILDEFQYIVESDPSFPSRLQRLIDTKLGDSNLMLVLCGSAVSFFEKKLLGYKSPLFGRRESVLRVRPLNFIQIRDFFPNYNVFELLTVYGIVGGVPAYLEKIDPLKNVDENIKTIITPGHYLYDEALNILRQEVREPRVYFTILATVAEGRTSLSEIASVSRIDPRSIGKYIDLLEELDIIRRVRPLGFRKPVKISFRDNYFRFWFTYIYKLRSLLEAGYIEEAYMHIKETLNKYLGQVFEDVIMEMIPRLHETKIIKTRPIEIGRWWHKDMEIDIIVRDPGKSTTFIEVKWREITPKQAKQIIKDLEIKATKTGLASPTNHYMLITKKIKDKENIETDEHRKIIDLETIAQKILASKKLEPITGYHDKKHY